MIYCPDCEADVEPQVIDCSFDHEFGVERIYDYVCQECGHLLRTTKTKPEAEFDEPY